MAGSLFISRPARPGDVQAGIVGIRAGQDGQPIAEILLPETSRRSDPVREAQHTITLGTTPEHLAARILTPWTPQAPPVRSSVPFRRALSTRRRSCNDHPEPPVLAHDG